LAKSSSLLNSSAFFSAFLMTSFMLAFSAMSTFRR
jgi:hypothetical protein